MPANLIDFDEARERRGMKRCPSCKSTKVASILYGLPTREFMDEEHDDVVLGGCIVSDGSPK